MNRLLDIGFEAVGHWMLTDGKLTFELTRYANEKNILYAFVCDGQIKYIGKSIRALAERLYGYKNPGLTQSTNIKNHNLLKDTIGEGVTIQIFALPDRGLMHYGVFHLNLAAALEDDIIRVINPDWKVASSVFGEIECMIGTIQAGFEITKNRVDPIEFWQILGLAATRDDRPVLAADISYPGKAP